MTTPDAQAVLRAAEGLTLVLPRLARRGRAGETLGAATGASLEMHDFRPYQPGDDLRQVDWNAMARHGELIIRTRQEEVMPRVEVWVDGSRSMALSDAKAARTAEVAALVLEVCRRQGLECALFTLGARPQRWTGAAAGAAVFQMAFDGRDDLPGSLRRAPPRQRCGVRVVVSDFLFEASLSTLAESCARDAALLHWVQVLDAEDLNPSEAFGARLEDAESDAALDRPLDAQVLARYQRRLHAHLGLLGEAASRVRASLVRARADTALEVLTRTVLRPLFASAGSSSWQPEATTR